jgi:hypothetical protein
MVLIAILAAVAVPASVGSKNPSTDSVIDPNLFRGVEVASIRGTAMTIPAPDPAYRSDGALDSSTVLLDPDSLPAPAGRPEGSTVQPDAPRGVVVVPAWHFDGNVSWYGPGFYGKRTACGFAYTQTIVGVAHRTLPCGTKVSFRNPDNGRIVTTTVIDRGPYVAGRTWDLSAGLCAKLGHCYTGTIFWKLP